MSNEVSSAAGICAVAPSTSAVPAGLTVTLPRPLPWSPGAAASSVPEPIPPRLSATVCGRSQPMSGRNAIVSGSVSVAGTGTSSSRSSSSSRAEQLRQEALRVDDVARQEELHLRRDPLVGVAFVLVVGCPVGWLAGRAGGLAGDAVEAVAAELERVDEVARSRPSARPARRCRSARSTSCSACTLIPFTLLVKSTSLLPGFSSSSKSAALCCSDSATSSSASLT